MTVDAIIDRVNTDHKNSSVSNAHMRDFLLRKAHAVKRRNEALWRQAVKDADAIVAMLIEKFDPEAIYQWGSVLNRTHFSEISDIDIAVEGLHSAERYFAMLGEAEALTHFPLDLVEMEHIEPEYADLIRKHGKCVYQRKCGS